MTEIIATKCRGCGQGFSVDNQLVGSAINSSLCPADGHSGPFEMVNIIAPQQG